MKSTAIVTGDSRGIGFAIARQLGEEGYNVVIIASGPKANYSGNLKDLEGRCIHYTYVQGDITKEMDRQKCLDAALQKYGSVEVLVNNAGVAPMMRTDLMELTEESFDHVISVNLKGTLFFSQLVARHMISRHNGIIVNIASLSSYVSSVNRGEYCIFQGGRKHGD